MGIGAYANKIFEDEKTVIYEYGNYNLNNPDFRNAEQKGNTVYKQQRP